MGNRLPLNLAEQCDNRDRDIGEDKQRNVTVYKIFLGAVVLMRFHSVITRDLGEEQQRQIEPAEG